MDRRRWTPVDQPREADWLAAELAHDYVVARVVGDRYAAYADLGWPDGGASLAHVAEVLARHTTTPDRCWFAMWEGYSMQGEFLRGSPTFRMLDLHHYLFRGSVADLVDLSVFLGTAGLDEPFATMAAERGRVHPPTNWWPDDRAWLAGWNIDAAYLLVGGSTALVGDLLDHPAIEARRTTPDAALDLG